MVRSCGGGGSGPLIHSSAIHFCGCVVVFARARSSLFMCGLLRSWWTVLAGCSAPRLWGGCCVRRHSLFVGGGARCRPQVERRPWGLIVIWGGVSSSVGGASPSVGGASSLSVGCHPCVLDGGVGGGARHPWWLEHIGGRSLA